RASRTAARVPRATARPPDPSPTPRPDRSPSSRPLTPRRRRQQLALISLSSPRFGAFRMSTDNNVDVVVIGGGPAGSTVSTILAQRGLKVRLFERDKFPRFHIGESLIPETYWVFKRLNMLDKMKKSAFVKKYSVQFVNAQGKMSAPF